MKRKPGTSKRKNRKLNTIFRDKKKALNTALTIEQINDIGMSGIEGAEDGEKLIKLIHKTACVGPSTWTPELYEQAKNRAGRGNKIDKIIDSAYVSPIYEYDK